MWTIRTKSLGFALAISAVAAGAVIPSTVAAQQAEARFNDSWFWGVRGGGMSVQTNVQDEFAPTAGLEWLITRQRMGLQIAIGQGFFDDVAVVIADDLGSPRDVRISDYRYASASLMAFPVQWGGLRPYAGLGLALNLIRRADTQSLDESTAQLVEEFRSTISPVLTLGAQAQVRNVAFFAEGAVLPTKREFLLSGNEAVFTVNAGLRFNLGSAIDPFN